MIRLFGVFCVLVATGQSVAATRVALVVGTRTQGVKTAIDLATARVSGLSGVELLERAGVERILAEHRLSLAGLADTGKAISAGKLLSADLLGVIEVAPGGRQALGLVVFDAKTGLRLFDAALPSGGPAREADGIVEGVQTALKKHIAGLARVRPVGFLSVRNADLPRAKDSYCESLALIVERRLVAAPSVGVLERQHLEAVTGERALPTQPAEKALLGAMVHLSLEVSRGPGGDGLRAIVLLTDPKGKPLGKVTAPVKESDPISGADTLARGICNALKTTPATGKSDPVREANRFLTEARQLTSFNQHVQALRAAESAHALDPADPAKRDLLARYLLGQGSRSIHPVLITPPRRILVSAEKLAIADELIRRGIDLRAAALKAVEPKNSQTLLPHILTYVGSDNELKACLNKIAALDQRRLSAEAKRHATAIASAAERWLCDEYLETLAAATERDSSLFEGYSRVFGYATSQLRLASPDAQHYTRKFIALMERWLDVVGKLGPARANFLFLNGPWSLITYTTQQAGHPVRWSPDPAELVLFDRLFDRMEKHPHPILRFQGRCGHLWVSFLSRKIAPEDSHRAFVALRRQTLSEIRKLPRNDSERMQVSYLLFVAEICTLDPLGLRQTKHQLEEQFDLWEQMLSQNVLLVEVLAVVPYLQEGTEQMAARKLKLLDQTLALLGSPRLRMFRGNMSMTRGNLSLERVKLLRAHPELAGKQGPLPWERVQPVVDVMDLPGIHEFRLPLVSGRDVYVIGLSNQPGRDFIQPIRVPLSGGVAQLLGKVSVRWGPPPRLGSAVPEKITGSVIDGGQIYVSTRSAGLYAFPLRGGPGRRIDQTRKLPSDEITAMALYEGRLYLGLGGGYFVSLDPVSGRFDVLASSRRRDKASPFDDGEQFLVPYITPDPERRRLIFLLFQGRSRPGAAHGLWAFDPRAKTFKRLLETGGVEYRMMGWPIHDGRVLLSTSHLAVDFDLATNKHVLLWASLYSFGPVLERGKALCQESFRAHGPHIYRNGWLWAASPFGRILIEKKSHEMFPPPQRRGNKPAGDLNVLQLVGKDQLLHGCPAVLWLYTLRKE
jgi:hypothetical protein